MTDAARALQQRFETGFARIAATRMAGVPVLNPALRVEMRGLQTWGDDWAAILVTPWFMNFVLVPAVSTARRIGEKRDIALPSGRYQAVWNHEADITGFWSCSLFSPMFEFADHDAAVATADAALVQMMAAPEAGEDSHDVRMAMVWSGVTATEAETQSETGTEAEIAAKTGAKPDAKTGSGPSPADAGGAVAEGPRQLSRRAMFRLPPHEPEAA